MAGFMDQVGAALFGQPSPEEVERAYQQFGSQGSAGPITQFIRGIAGAPDNALNPQTNPDLPNSAVGTVPPIAPGPMWSPNMPPANPFRLPGTLGGPLVPYRGAGQPATGGASAQPGASGGPITPYQYTGQYQEGVRPLIFRPGAGGNTYQGSTVGRDVVPTASGGGGRGYVPGSQGTPSTGGAGGSGTGSTNGGQLALPPGTTARNVDPKNWFEKMWGGATTGEKALGLGGALGAAETARQWLGNIFGDDGVEAQERPKIPWPDQGGAGGGAGGGSAFRMPQSYRAELAEMIPSVDYENLPRPPFERVYQQMQDLAPDAPEERTFLDKLPANMKNILGFGILLGPVGLLLGAGMGMSENKAIDRAQQEKFKQESRQHLREMLGFEIDWGKAERAMALEEQQGMRDQAMGNLELDLSMQNHELGLMQAQDQMATNASRRAAISHDMRGGQFDIDKLFERAMLIDPQGSMMELQNASQQMMDMGITPGSVGKDMYNQMLMNNIVGAMYQ